MSKENKFYIGLREFLGPFIKAWFRLKIEGSIPKKKPLLLVANHPGVDPIFISAAIKEELYWVTDKKTVKDHWFRGPVTKHLNCIYVEEEKIDGIRKVLDKLNENKIVVIFPSAGREDKYDKTGIKNIYDGTSWLALKSKCDIIPIGISGAYNLFKKGALIPFYRKVKVKIGKPIKYSVNGNYNSNDNDNNNYHNNHNKKNIQKLNNIIKKSIENLIEFY